jgi:hypothetical protein
LEAFRVELFIYRQPRFNKKLDSLRKSGGSGALAAKRVEHLIQKLADQKQTLFQDEYTLTKHGELRLLNCRKFDLGGGYRLICVKHGGNLILPYVGTHDDCDRWLENNRGFETSVDDMSPLNPSKARAESGVNAREADEGGNMPDYEDVLMERLDDKTLRRVFRGLTGE